MAGPAAGIRHRARQPGRTGEKRKKKFEKTIWLEMFFRIENRPFRRFSKDSEERPARQPASGTGPGSRGSGTGPSSRAGPG